MAGVASDEAISTFIPGITPYRYTTANLHGLQYGRAASVPKKDASEHQPSHKKAGLPGNKIAVLFLEVYTPVR